ncbi:MAG: ubiquinol-cytochrome c reductase iron-sulfur subunit [Thermodesulfovibrionales bacterium]|jgi:cytochrome b6-f complex iron-sulfur subunit
MKRRSFLHALLAILSSTALVSFAYPLLRFLAPPPGEAKTRKLILEKGEVPIGGFKDIVFDDMPAIVINSADKGLVAFSRVCTHLGCLVEYDKDKKRMLCPCHAGVFDLEGNVVSGPPPRPLAKLPLRIEGETIVIG